MIFALLLFGCADDGSQCEQLRAPAIQYEARITCEADAEMALQSEVSLRADYPTVEARCEPVGNDPSVALNAGDPAERRAVASVKLAAAQPRPR
jgi:hypothetical protein